MKFVPMIPQDQPPAADSGPEIDPSLNAFVQSFKGKGALTDGSKPLTGGKCYAPVTSSGSFQCTANPAPPSTNRSADGRLYNAVLRDPSGNVRLAPATVGVVGLTVGGRERRFRAWSPGPRRGR